MLPAKVSAAHDHQVGHKEDHVAHPVRPGVLHHEQLDMRLESEDGHEAAGDGQLKTQDRENLQNTNKTTSKLTAAHC